MCNPSRPRLLRGLFLGFALALTGASTAAAPYIPTDDAQVLEHLPGELSRLGRRIAQLQQLHALSPARAPDPTLAVSLARSYIERARRSGDPRWTGYAQGALAPWWKQANPPPEVRLLRATIAQSRHQFTAALADLDALLQTHPGHAQAWLTRATVLRVQGRFAEAAQACAGLQRAADGFPARLCAYAVQSAQGALATARAAMPALLAQAARQPLGVQAWFYAEWADMHERAGQGREAEAVYRQALRIAPNDLGLRTAYADALLTQGRPADALAVIRTAADAAPDAGRADALLLRELLALHALKQPTHHLHAELADSHAAARQRQDAEHLREEARMTLHVERNPTKALLLARQNWAEQREAADAHLLLAASLAAQQPQAARPVQDWLRDTGFEDARLAPLLAQIEKQAAP